MFSGVVVVLYYFLSTFAPAYLQGRVKFPTGGKVREPSCVVRQSFQVLRAADEAEPLKLRYRQYAEQSADSLDGRRIIYAFYAIRYSYALNCMLKVTI